MSDIKKLLLIGAGEFADIAYEYFSQDSQYEVVGFAVEQAYLTEPEKFGLPVVALEEAVKTFPPDDVHAHVAVTSTQLNQVRERLVGAARAMGYHLANYISSRAFVWRTATLGDNVFIFENNVVQHGVTIGDGVVLWSGNHIGHQTVVEDFCFISSHVVISGYCRIGRRSFVGVNASFADNITIGPDCFVALAAVVNKTYPDGGQILSGHYAEPSRVSSYRYFKIKA
ncbi:acetyltransferase [Phaeobacter sp.]|uniref:acetyltransferase n=1 Tax=Phaeobacter sp. TaxID=1902409 RepID=UPI0025F89325|nr:acetyltransferase [Phaeobacter sp.]